MNHRHHTRGYTIIEILIVIGIMGMIAYVVVPELRVSRVKAHDVAAKANLVGIRAGAESVRNALGDFGPEASDCSTTDSLFATTSPIDIAAQVAGAVQNGGGPAACFTRGNPTNGWIITMPLQGGGYWCVDSEGGSHATITQAVSGAGKCI